MKFVHIPKVEHKESGLRKLFISLLADAVKRDEEYTKKLFNL